MNAVDRKPSTSAAFEVVAPLCEELKAYVETQEGLSYDPYDIVHHEPFRFFFQHYQNRWARFGILPFFAFTFFAPVLSRKLYGVRKTQTASGLAHEIEALMSRFSRVKDPMELKKAKDRLKVLISLASPTGGWGLPFPIPRSYKQEWPANLSFAHTTCRVLESILRFDSYDLDERAKHAFEHGLEFLDKGLFWKSLPDGRLYCSFTPAEELWILNAMVDVAAIFLHPQSIATRSNIQEKGRRIIETMFLELNTQNRWPYSASIEGTPPVHDGLHTAMVMNALIRCFDRDPTLRRKDDYVQRFEKALEQYLSDFFVGHPLRRPLMVLGNQSLTNIADWAESARAYRSYKISFLAVNTRLDSLWEDLLMRSLKWVVEKMKYPDGHFAYQYRDFLGRFDPQSLRFGNALMWEAFEGLRSLD